MQDTANLFRESIHIKRLGDKAREPYFTCAVDFSRMHRTRDDGNMRLKITFKDCNGLAAILIRHLQIQQDNIKFGTLLETGFELRCLLAKRLYSSLSAKCAEPSSSLRRRTPPVSRLRVSLKRLPGRQRKKMPNHNPITANPVRMARRCANLSSKMPPRLRTHSRPAILIHEITAIGTAKKSNIAHNVPQKRRPCPVAERRIACPRART